MVQFQSHLWGRGEGQDDIGGIPEIPVQEASTWHVKSVWVVLPSLRWGALPGAPHFSPSDVRDHSNYIMIAIPSCRSDSWGSAVSLSRCAGRSWKVAEPRIGWRSPRAHSPVLLRSALLRSRVGLGQSGLYIPKGTHPVCGLPREAHLWVRQVPKEGSGG